MWQQHVVTAKAASLKVGKTVSFCTISGEDISIPEARLVWCSKQNDTLRVCYNRLVPTSGMSGMEIVKRTGNLVKMRQRKTGVELLVNTKLHKLYRGTY